MTKDSTEKDSILEMFFDVCKEALTFQEEPKTGYSRARLDKVLKANIADIVHVSGLPETDKEFALLTALIVQSYLNILYSIYIKELG